MSHDESTLHTKTALRKLTLGIAALLMIQQTMEAADIIVTDVTILPPLELQQHSSGQQQNGERRVPGDVLRLPHTSHCLSPAAARASGSAQQRSSDSAGLQQPETVAARCVSQTLGHCSMACTLLAAGAGSWCYLAKQAGDHASICWAAAMTKGPWRSGQQTGSQADGLISCIAPVLLSCGSSAQPRRPERRQLQGGNDAQGRVSLASRARAGGG
jgi:hypothetical protein